MDDYIELSKLSINESGFIINPKSGEMLNLDTVERYIFKNLKQNKTKKELISLMAQEFNTEKNIAKISYEDFVVKLLMYKII